MIRAVIDALDAVVRAYDHNRARLVAREFARAAGLPGVGLWYGDYNCNRCAFTVIAPRTGDLEAEMVLRSVLLDCCDGRTRSLVDGNLTFALDADDRADVWVSA